MTHCSSNMVSPYSPQIVILPFAYERAAFIGTLCPFEVAVDTLEPGVGAFDTTAMPLMCVSGQLTRSTAIAFQNPF